MSNLDIGMYNNRIPVQEKYIKFKMTGASTGAEVVFLPLKEISTIGPVINHSAEGNGVIGRFIDIRTGTITDHTVSTTPPQEKVYRISLPTATDAAKVSAAINEFADFVDSCIRSNHVVTPIEHGTFTYAPSACIQTEAIVDVLYTPAK